MRVIDLFAGPGGLAEGFSSVRNQNGDSMFDVRLSVEKEADAFETLRLRKFYRQFPFGTAPDEYYAFLRGELSKDVLYQCYRDQAEAAAQATWKATLGDPLSCPDELLDARITDSLEGDQNWLLIGGPPCQAYSLVGRSRRRWTSDYVPDELADKDQRYFLYRHYLRVLGRHAPSAFVMENVPGLLSVIADGKPLVNTIVGALAQPGEFLRDEFGIVNDCPRYNLFSLKHGAWESGQDPRRFLLMSENYGVPQTRHRLIIVGVREDVRLGALPSLDEREEVTLAAAIGDLPKLRSGLSREADSLENWRAALNSARETEWFETLEPRYGLAFALAMNTAIEHALQAPLDRGGEFVMAVQTPDALDGWYADPRMQGQCCHSSRGHLVPDLHRYLFNACFSAVLGRPPRLEDLPEGLLPEHKNAKCGTFTDRFRTQSANAPAKTITSHISRDGHYFIHYDPTQCRSLTVREAARVQTFPDNYFFCGGRTSQYEQVGNAVPPYLAYLIGLSLQQALPIQR